MSDREYDMRKAALYLRVSALDLTSANHEHELREIASRMDREIVKVYREEDMGGTTDQKHPKLEKLCSDAYNRKFDIVMAWSVDQLGRSLHDLVGFLSEIHALTIDLYLHKQGLDTTTPAGTAIFAMTDVFAEFERAVIRNRFRDGWAKARRNGKLRGRRRIASAVENAIRDALLKGDAGMLKIATRFGVGTGTVQRIKAEMTSEGAA
jgi:DNA invertase Pin-like site-specific DNA recombinase